ncbi:MAG: L-lactate permease [Egibacteraceae bacterium]
MAVDALLAGTPVVLILVLMVALRWSAARAGLAGVAATAVVALAAFGFGRGVDGQLAAGTAFGGVVAESAFTAATILWIIVPALAIHHLQNATGATEVLRLALGRLTADPRLLAVLIAWFFALFVEGAAGFGASVALAAPFLVSSGFPRVDAVAIPMVGHAIGVSFGAVGTPIIPQVAATGLSGLELSRATGIYHVLLGGLLLTVVLLLVRRALPAAGQEHGRLWPWGVLAGASFLLPYHLLSRHVGPELPTLGGALAGGAVFAGALLVARRTAARTTAGSATPTGAALETEGGPPTGGARAAARAAAPYLVLVAAVLTTRLVPVVRDTLTAVTLDWELGGRFTGSIAPLYHPGTMLVVGFAIGALLQGTSAGAVWRAVRTTVGRLGPVAVALVAMLAISRLMVHAGMTDSLAVAATAAAGGGWPLVAPLVGALGTFVTGSATASNILFTDFQVATAESLALPVPAMAGAQGAGAAIGNIVCPHNIVAAGATVGLSGQEGDVLRRTAWIALAYALAAGVLAWWFA